MCTGDAIKLLVRNSSKKIESRLLEVVEFERNSECIYSLLVESKQSTLDSEFPEGLDFSA